MGVAGPTRLGVVGIKSRCTKIEKGTIGEGRAKSEVVMHHPSLAPKIEQGFIEKWEKWHTFRDPKLERAEVDSQIDCCTVNQFRNIRIVDYDLLEGRRTREEYMLTE